MAGPVVHSVRWYHHDAVTVPLANFPHDCSLFCSLLYCTHDHQTQLPSLHPSCCLINSINNIISCVLWFFYRLLAACSQSECISIPPCRLWLFLELLMAIWAHSELDASSYGLSGLSRLSLAPIQPFLSRLYPFFAFPSLSRANHIASSLHPAAPLSSSVCSPAFNLHCLAPPRPETYPDHPRLQTTRKPSTIMCIEWVCQFCQVLNKDLGDGDNWDRCGAGCVDPEERWSEVSYTLHAMSQ